MTDSIPELSDLAKSFKPGIYKHFKGPTYEAYFVARDSEHRHEEYVVYRSIDKNTIWIRPLTMFLETVDRDGYRGPRFTWVGEANDK